MQKATKRKATKKSTKVRYFYEVDGLDVTLHLNRLEMFIRNRFVGKMYEAVEIYYLSCNPVAYRFWMGKEEFYWIPSEYDGSHKITSHNDLLVLLQGLEMFQVPGEKAAWWVLRRGNSHRIDTQKIKGHVINYAPKGEPK